MHFRQIELGSENIFQTDIFHLSSADLKICDIFKWKHKDIFYLSVLDLKLCNVENVDITYYLEILQTRKSMNIPQ